MPGSPPRVPPRLLFEGVLLACLVRGGLRLMSLRRLVRLLGRLPEARQPRSPDVCIAAAGAAVRRAAHPTCLFAALVSFGLLARRGHDVTFHLGVASAPSFEAHAWLTLAACRLDEHQDSFAPIWDYRVVRRAA
jgi:hypothetical protein